MNNTVKAPEKGVLAYMLSASFLLICAVSFLCRLGIQVRMTVLPVYSTFLGFTKSTTGLITSFYTVSGILFRPLIGKMIDRVGRKRILSIGLILMGITVAGYAFFESIYMICALSVFCGLGFAIMTTTLATMVTDLFPDSMLSKGLGYFGLAATFSVALGPTISLWVLGDNEFKKAFLFGGLFVALSLFALLFLKYEKYIDEETEAKRKQKKEAEAAARLSSRAASGRWWEKLVEPCALKSAAIICFVTLCGATETTFLVTYAGEKGIAGIGTYFTLRAIGLALARVAVGKISEKIGNSLTLSISLLVMGAGYFGIMLSRSLTPLLVIALVSSFANGISQITCNVTSVLKAPRERRGSANATYYLFMDVGQGIGALVWGFVADITGRTGSMFVGCAVFMAIGAFLALLFRRDFDLSKEE